MEIGKRNKKGKEKEKRETGKGRGKGNEKEKGKRKFLTLYMRIRHLVWLRISPPPSGKKSPDPELLIRFIQ